MMLWIHSNASYLYIRIIRVGIRLNFILETLLGIMLGEARTGTGIMLGIILRIEIRVGVGIKLST